METIEVINKITEQIALLNRQPLEDFSGDTLSRIGVRLAAYKAGMGKYVNEAKKDVWLAEKRFKEAKATGFMELKAEGNNSTDARELTVIKASAAYDALIEAQVLEDKVTTLAYNVHDLIDAIKSRVINVQMEMRENK